MSFVSFNFLCFIMIVFLAYFLTPNQYKWTVLLFSSYIFYALSDFRMILFIIFTTITVFLSGLSLDGLHGKQKELFRDKDREWLKENKKRYIAEFTKRRRRVVTIVLLINFGILAFLKYFDFITENVNAVLSSFSFHSSIPRLNLILPLGISFYTFQSLGYVIDVYRGKYPAEKNAAKFALFVSFFPQIIQGPISRYDQLAHQLYEPQRFDYASFKNGLLLIGWGFFKKLVIADRAALIVDAVIPSYRRYQGFEIAVAVIAFMIQVYGDFSGGMDIARGVAQCVGVDMVQNFERPHFAVSISDYWRRWHITLGGWMKDYLLYTISLSKAFAKLGKKARKVLGNYLGKLFPTCLAMSIVFLVVGIWHGPSWKYVAFGFYNGGLIVIGILLTVPMQKFNAKYPKVTTKHPIIRMLSTGGTLFLVFVSKYFATAPSLAIALRMIQSTFRIFNPGVLVHGYFDRIGFDKTELVILALGCLAFFTISFLQERGKCVRDVIAKQNIVIRWLVYYALILAILLLAVDTGEEVRGFVYEQF